MPGEFFFMAIGGLGVSLAGFAGLIAALSSDQQRHSATARWRIGRVVVWGLHVTMIGFGVIALYALLEDVRWTARTASAIAAIVVAVRTWRSSRPGPAWPIERERRATMALWTVQFLFVLGNVALGNVGYLHLIMLLLLAEPAAVFVAAVQEATSDPTTPEPDLPAG